MDVPGIHAIETVLAVMSGVGVGLGVGLFFFGTLWVTVQKLRDVERPKLLLAGSFVGRSSVACFAFYVLSTRSSWMVLGGASGFLLARQLFLRRLAPRSRVSTSIERAGG